MDWKRSVKSCEARRKVTRNDGSLCSLCSSVGIFLLVTTGVHILDQLKVLLTSSCVFFSCRNHHYSKSWMAVFCSYISGNWRKNPRDLGQNIVAFFNEKNGKDISSNTQLDKLYRHHSDRNSKHPIVPAQELVTESQSWEWFQETTHISPALKYCISVISDRSSSNLV